MYILAWEDDGFVTVSACSLTSYDEAVNLAYHYMKLKDINFLWMPNYFICEV